ncbi:MAG: AMP-binding protein [Desulfurococcales archaeon]|nr:AMP-binding protein [Desulfurococcales archaeon]
MKIWRPPREVVQNANVSALMEKLGYSNYHDLVRKTTRDHRWFWGSLPDFLGIEWFRPPRETVDLSQGPEWAKWYRGALFNASYNVLDRIVTMGYGNREAFTWVGEDGAERTYTYNELLDEVQRFSNFLDEVGIKPGDVIAIYAPMGPESIIAMLSAMRIGAIASPIFSGFAPGAVAERIKSSNARILFTGDYYFRRGKKITLLDRALKADEISGRISEYIIVARRGKTTDLPEDDRIITYDDTIRGKRASREPEELDPEHPALLLFTSGTTGSPKGAVISHIGSVIQPAKEHFYNLDTKPVWDNGNDRLWWITDLGWMMGPWQVMGAQFLGSKHLVVEGAIDYPSKTRMWELIEKYKVTQFGFAATVARLLKTLTPEPSENNDVESIRILGNTGEPIDPDTWIWVVEKVGGDKAPMINLSGGTEIFGCILLPSPVVDLKPSTLWGPGLGMDADVFDDTGEPVRGSPGYLVVKKPSPSMTRGLWKDPERYIRTYWSRFPGVWYHGDLAYIDEDGYWFILGRADDVIKVAGKRIGPAEIEAILNDHPEIVESACIGIPHPVKGEVVSCFVIPRKEFSPGLEEELKRRVANSLGKPFTPYSIIPVRDLPRTRSGKIMRRIIKALFRGETRFKTEVMDNPESVEEVRTAIEKLKEHLKA